MQSGLARAERNRRLRVGGCKLFTAQRRLCDVSNTLRHTSPGWDTTMRRRRMSSLLFRAALCGADPQSSPALPMLGQSSSDYPWSDGAPTRQHLHQTEQRARRGVPFGAAVPAAIDSVSRSVENNSGCVDNCQRSLAAAFWFRSQHSFWPHVRSPQAVGNGSPHKASQGSSAPPSGSLVGAHSGRKRYSAGSVTRAVRLERSPSRTLDRTRSRHLQHRIPAFANAASDKALQGSPNCFRPVCASEIAAAERYWWRYCIVNENCAKQSLSSSASTTPHLASDTDKQLVIERLQLTCQAFFQSSYSLLALAHDMADIPQEDGKSERPGGWYQLAPVHFHHHAESRVKHKAQLI